MGFNPFKGSSWKKLANDAVGTITIGNCDLGGCGSKKKSGKEDVLPEDATIDQRLIAGYIELDPNTRLVVDATLLLLLVIVAWISVSFIFTIINILL